VCIPCSISCALSSFLPSDSWLLDLLVTVNIIFILPISSLKCRHQAARSISHCQVLTVFNLPPTLPTILLRQ
jgi:hypothetical protein